MSNSLLAAGSGLSHAKFITKQVFRIKVIELHIGYVRQSLSSAYENHSNVTRNSRKIKQKTTYNNQKKTNWNSSLYAQKSVSEGRMKNDGVKGVVGD